MSNISSEIDLALVAQEFEKIIGTDLVKIHVNSAEYINDVQDKIIGTLQAMRVPFAISDVDAETLTLTIYFDAKINSEVQKAEALKAINKITGTLNGTITGFILEEPIEPPESLEVEGTYSISIDSNASILNGILPFDKANNTSPGFEGNDSGDGIKVINEDKKIDLTVEGRITIIFLDNQPDDPDLIVTTVVMTVVDRHETPIFPTASHTEEIYGDHFSYNHTFSDIESKIDDEFKIKYEVSFDPTTPHSALFFDTGRTLTAVDKTPIPPPEHLKYNYTSFLQSDLPADPSRVSAGDFKGVYTVTGTMLLTKESGGLIISNSIKTELEIDDVSGVLKFLSSATALSKESESPTSIGQTQSKGYVNNQTNSFKLDLVYEDSPICNKLIELVNINTTEQSANIVVKYKKTYPSGLVIERDCIIVEMQEVLQAGAYATITITLLIASDVLIVNDD